MSKLLAGLLVKSKSVSRDLWIAETRTSFGTEPNDSVIEQHLHYWDAIVRTVDTGVFDELKTMARQAGEYQCAQGLEVATAVQRTVEATNMIEMALLEANGEEASRINVLSEIAELRSMLVMGVISGYNDAIEKAASKLSNASEQLREALKKRNRKYQRITLAAGEEIGPLDDEELRFYFVESGKVRLYNLLPTGRTVTVSLLGQNEVFLQWRARTDRLSCICAEAMQPSEVVGVSEKDFVDLIAAQPAAALDVISSFAQRLSESAVLIKDLMDNSINLRLYRTLVELAQQFGQESPNRNAVVIDVPLTHQRLADMVGSNRVTVTRKLLELQKRGLVAGRGSGSIEILDMNALRELATHPDS